MKKTSREIALEKQLLEHKSAINILNKQKDDAIASRDKLIVEQQKEIESLKKQIYKQNKEIEKQAQQLKRKNDIILLNNYNRFFSNSERTKDVLKKAKNVKTIEKASTTSTKQEKRGRKAGTKNHQELGLDLITPDETITLFPKEIEAMINNGECIIVDKDRLFKIEKKPATYCLKEIIRPKYLDSKTGKIYQVLSNQAFGKSIITPSFVSNAIYLKYCLCMPINKLSKYIRDQYGIIISNQSWCDYFLKAVTLLEPLFLQISKELVHNTAGIIHLDETSVSISKAKNGDERTKHYYLCAATTYYDHTIRYYKYIKARQISNDIDILSNYKGVIVCDGFTSYNKLTDIKIQRCWVHARRYVSDSIKIHEVKKVLPQVELLEAINKLFEIEDKIKDADLSDIIHVRNTESTLVLNNIKKQCQQNAKTKIDSFKKAIEYIDRYWDELCLFLTNPCIPIHNNQAERTVGYFVQARKNFQTMASETSAAYNAKLFTIAMTSYANGLNVENYLCHVMNALHQGEDIQELLPWHKNIQEKFAITSK